MNSFTAGGLSFASITIAADILTPGAKYRFVLKVSHGGTVGVSSMEVQVRSGPTSGQLTTESDTVEALQPLTLRGRLLQYDTIQYNTIRHNTVQYNTTQYSTIQYDTIQYNTIRHNTVQYNTTQYSTIQYDTIQYNTIQYNTIQ